MPMEAFSLGLTVGAWCMASCVPASLPLLLGPGEAGKRAVLSRGVPLLAAFLGGRFCAYLLLGLVAGIFGEYGPGRLLYSNYFLAVTQLALALLMLLHVLGYKRLSLVSCGTGAGAGGCHVPVFSFPSAKSLALAGFLSSLSLCPPVLLAIVAATEQGNVLHGVAFFFVFFLATSIYMLPLCFVPLCSLWRDLKNVSKVLCAGAAIYYIYRSVSVFIATLQ